MHSTCGRDAQARSKAIRKIEGAVSFKEIAKLATWQTDLEALCCKEIGKNQGIMSLIETNLETQEVNLKTLEEALAVSKPLIDGIQLRRASVVADRISSANGFFEIVQNFQEQSKCYEDIDAKVA